MPTVPPSQQEQAYHELLQRIIYSEYRPGMKIALKQVCADLDLGRTPVRESLVRLGQQGIVYTIPQSGTFVSKIDLQSAEDARFTREQLERIVAVECCVHADAAALAALSETIEEGLQYASEHERRGFFDSDNHFHKQLFEIAGRQRIWGWLESASVHLLRYRWLRVLATGLPWDTIVQQHQTLYRAIEQRRPDEAQYLISQHLHLMLEERNDVIRAFPDCFAETD